MPTRLDRPAQNHNDGGQAIFSTLEYSVSESLIPKKKVGIFSPRTIVDNGVFEFYIMAPKGIMLAVVPMGVEAFTRADVDRIFAALDGQLEELRLRKVDLLYDSAVPLQCMIGVDGHDRRLARMTERTGIPANSAILGAIEAAKHLGIKKIAFGNKSADAVNDVLTQFFTRGGVEVVGYTAWKGWKNPTDQREVKSLGDDKLVEIGYEVARRTFEEHPDADGIYMPGGSWALNDVILDLEKEFGKPILGHRHVIAWHIAKCLGMWEPKEGYGRLLASA